MENEKFQELVIRQFEKIDQKFEKIDERFDKMEQRFDELSKNQEVLARHVLRIENKMDDKFGALFDFVDYQKGVNKEVLGRLDKVEKKVDRLELETAHLRAVRH